MKEVNNIADTTGRATYQSSPTKISPAMEQLYFEMEDKEHVFQIGLKTILEQNHTSVVSGRIDPAECQPAGRTGHRSDAAGQQLRLFCTDQSGFTGLLHPGLWHRVDCHPVGADHSERLHPGGELVPACDQQPPQGGTGAS